MKYIIKIYMPYRSYLGKGAYTFQGEKYAVIVEKTSEAKRYSSRKIAENAYKLIFLNLANLPPKYEIKEIEE